MTGRESPFPIEQRLRPLQVVVGALAVGVITFAAIAAFATASQVAAPVNPVVQTALLVAVIGIMFSGLAVRTFVRGSIVGAAADGMQEEQLFGRFSAWTIITAALLEAAALLGVTLYLLTRDPTALVLAAAALLLMLGAAFPTRSRWETLREDALGRSV